jgi:hypothetical protein
MSHVEKVLFDLNLIEVRRGCLLAGSNFYWPDLSVFVRLCNPGEICIIAYALVTGAKIQTLAS